MCVQPHAIAGAIGKWNIVAVVGRTGGAATTPTQNLQLLHAFSSLPEVNNSTGRLQALFSTLEEGNASMSTKSKIVVTRDLGPQVMPLLTQRPDLDIVLWEEDRVVDRDWLLKNILGAVGLLVMITDKIDKEIFDAAGPSLRVFSTMSVGYEHADLAEVAKRGIRFGYTPDVLTGAVADLSVMLALMAGRNGGENISLVKDSKWPQASWAPFALCGPQLSTSDISPKRTVGFIGFGRIAQATLARLIPFGITDCLYTSNPSTPTSLEHDEALRAQHNLQSLCRVGVDDLARESDVLFVLAPGGEKTRHLVDEKFLRAMKKNSVLVNTSRGTLVDSDALAKALRERWIWGAGLDVIEGEPMVTAEHPLVREPRCVVLPHVGSGTLETRLGMATLAVENLLAGLDGEAMPAELDVKSRL